MEHSFDVDIAVRYGIHAAILLKNIYFWTEKNRANGKNIYDGKVWTYNSKKAFAELFPYFTPRQIDYALTKLKDAGLIVTGNYNKEPRDKTLWYAVTKEGYCILQNCAMEETKLCNGRNKIVQALPDSKLPDDKPDNKQKESADALTSTDTTYVSKNHQSDSTKKAQKKQEVRHKYGEYDNVLLSDTELEKLKNEFPDDWQEWIERVSGYVAQRGKGYSNYLATIRNWARKDAQKQASQKKGFTYNDHCEEGDSL